MTITTSAATGAGSYTDRWLCSAAHLADGYAGYVLDNLTDRSPEALGPAPGMDLIALARHARKALVHRRRLQLRQSLILAGTLLIAVAVIAASGEAAAGALVLLLAVAWASGFAVLLTHRIGGYRRALDVRDSVSSPRDLAPPIDPAVEAYLESVMSSNVVVFSGKEPFVGSGVLLARWQLHVNCTRPAAPGTPVRPFTVTDLHKQLTLAARRTGIPGLDVRNRLFVHGGAARRVPGLVADPVARPATRVDAATLRAGITTPQPDNRTYLCLRKISWGGDLVVEAFVRVERTAAYLIVEHHAFVLLPLRSELCVAEHLATSIPARTVVAAATGALGGLVTAPSRMLRDANRGGQRERALRRAKRMVRRHPVHDYGAESGLREEVASDERIGLFQYADEERDLGILRQAMLESISDFLDEHGIDTSDFSKQQTRIVTQSISIGSITNGNTVIGNGGAINQQQPQQQQKQQPGSTQPPAAPWAPGAKP
ncbi:hypothetical protein FB565_004015 [Actinoplanes lutulentus]|uniref:Uncharacterized protein n=1 Tax=Actinoplanes lutulentus TaxID=1287878 RepID=A0A327ZJR0_9ACTN|nr:hypothetical protein [Actinoplanes lutulentus]MBB2944286.1 hypothetical protein [Actinoplanes lutulentus]RAK42481.1 hypothetical protein B0I29_102306 [Actinoplanes lutulentus]